MRPCGSGTLRLSDGKRHFGCQQTCDKILRCGQHRCSKQCHSGACDSCPRALPLDDVQLCACGKTEFHEDELAQPRDSCLDPLPTCGKVCDRVLNCGVHRCTQNCHDSPCQPCSQNIQTPCRCGLTQLTVECAEFRSMISDSNRGISSQDLAQKYPWLLCKTICNKRMSCTNHKCKTKCCPHHFAGAFAHICSEVCNKPLGCGSHTCPDYCHGGKCAPCKINLWDGVSCTCGAQKIPGPVPCGTQPPVCNRPCTAPRECGHRCAYTCHMGPCAPCVVLVEKPCAGGHTVMTNVRCCTHPEKLSCGKACNKLLSCGFHTCSRKCHSGPCATSLSSSSSSDSSASSESIVSSCQQTCLRPLLCGHACKAPCHPESSICPDQNCKDAVKLSCACGRISRQIACFEASQLAASQGISSQPESSPSPAPVLPCDSVCALQERKRRFREALSLYDNSNVVKQTDSTYIPYSKVVLEAAEKEMEFVLEMEKLMINFINDPDQHKRCHFLPPMNHQQRYLVHLLADAFSLESEAFDPEPRRSIRLTRGETSHVPALLVSAAVRSYQKLLSSQTVKTAEEWPKPCTLVFYDFATNDIRTRDVHNFLKHCAGEYRLVNLNAEEVATLHATGRLQTTSSSTSSSLTCLAIFGNADAAKRALKGINTLGLLRVKLASDSEDATVRARQELLAQMAAEDLSESDLNNVFSASTSSTSNAINSSTTSSAPVTTTTSTTTTGPVLVSTKWRSRALEKEKEIAASLLSSSAPAVVTDAWDDEPSTSSAVQKPANTASSKPSASAISTNRFGSLAGWDETTEENDEDV